MLDTHPGYSCQAVQPSVPSMPYIGSANAMHIGTTDASIGNSANRRGGFGLKRRASNKSVLATKGATAALRCLASHMFTMSKTSLSFGTYGLVYVTCTYGCVCRYVGSVIDATDVRGTVVPPAPPMPPSSVRPTPRASVLLQPIPPAAVRPMPHTSVPLMPLPSVASVDSSFWRTCNMH